jgi:sarcosine oxidase gamma subunit
MIMIIIISMLLKEKVQEARTCVYEVPHALASSSARKNASVNISHAKTAIPVTDRGGPWVVRRRGSSDF